MQTDPIALGRAEAERLIRDETGVWMMAGEMWTSAARHIVCRVMTSLGLDQHDYRQRDKGIMAIADTLNAMLDEACRAADGYGALERERDELKAKLAGQRSFFKSWMHGESKSKTFAEWWSSLRSEVSPSCLTLIEMAWDAAACDERDRLAAEVAELRRANEALRNRLNPPSEAKPWQEMHEFFGCTHPPGCEYCSWCGFSAPTSTPERKDGQP